MNEFENPMLLNNQAMEYLRKARRWAGLISILALVFIALMLVIAALLLVNSGLSGAFSGLEIVPLFLMIVIYFFPIWYLYQFSHQAKLALNQQDETALAHALRYLWLHYRYLGVLLICMFVLYALVIMMGVLPFSSLPD